MADFVVTERLAIDVEDAPECNPIALYWLSKQGGWAMWVFGKTQTEGKEVATEGVFEQHVEELSTATKRKQFVAKRSEPQISLGYSNLPTDKVRGISTILDAVTILMLTSEPGELPPTFVNVNIEAGSWKVIETENDRHDLEFTIHLPELYNQEI